MIRPLFFVKVVGLCLGDFLWDYMLLSKDLIQQACSDALLYVIKDGQVARKDWNDFQSCELTFSIDSRTIQPGQGFFALKGPHFDGHDFIAAAAQRGASLVVGSNYDAVVSVAKNIKQQLFVVIVSDVYQALVDLAKVYRASLKIPFVGITGSVGKTSTKEMFASMLDAAGVHAFSSFKNQNNTIGLPLNILNVSSDHACAVFELGISEKGEMAQLVDMLLPDIALITCIAHAHGEGLGGLQGIAAQKRLIFKNFNASNIGVVFGDQDILSNVAYPHPVSRFGFKIKNQVQARKVRSTTDDDGNLITTFTLKWYKKKVDVQFSGNHLGRVNNALAASTLAYLLDLSLDSVIQGLKQYQGVEGRFEVKQMKEQYQGSVINDCYNANPESMKAALMAFDEMQGYGQKVAVLGDMLELGAKELYWHRQIGRFLEHYDSINSVILVGKRAHHIAQTAPSQVSVMLAKDYKEAGKLLEKLLKKEKSLVLVKGSNGMQLARMVELFV